MARRGSTWSTSASWSGANPSKARARSNLSWLVGVVLERHLTAPARFRRLDALAQSALSDLRGLVGADASAGTQEASRGPALVSALSTRLSAARTALRAAAASAHEATAALEHTKAAAEAKLVAAQAQYASVLDPQGRRRADAEAPGAERAPAASGPAASPAASAVTSPYGQAERERYQAASEALEKRWRARLSEFGEQATAAAAGVHSRADDAVHRVEQAHAGALTLLQAEFGLGRRFGEPRRGLLAELRALLQDEGAALAALQASEVRLRAALDERTLPENRLDELAALHRDASARLVFLGVAVADAPPQAEGAKKRGGRVKDEAAPLDFAGRVSAARAALDAAQARVLQEFADSGDEAAARSALLGDAQDAGAGAVRPPTERKAKKGAAPAARGAAAASAASAAADAEVARATAERDRLVAEWCALLDRVDRELLPAAPAALLRGLGEAAEAQLAAAAGSFDGALAATRAAADASWTAHAAQLRRALSGWTADAQFAEAQRVLEAKESSRAMQSLSEVARSEASALGVARGAVVELVKKSRVLVDKLCDLADSSARGLQKLRSLNLGAHLAVVEGRKNIKELAHSSVAAVRVLHTLWCVVAWVQAVSAFHLGLPFTHITSMAV